MPLNDCLKNNSAFCSFLFYGNLGLGGLLALTVIILFICLYRIHKRVKRLERNKIQQLEREPHYASLQKLPVSSSDGETMEDTSTDYACIAKKKPT